MARRTRLVLLALGLLLAAIAVAAAEPSLQEMFARARRALRERPSLDSEADSPSTPPWTPPAAPAASSEEGSPSLTNDAPNSPAARLPAPGITTMLALPASPTAHPGPPRDPPASSTSQQRALPSGRTAAPTCTFVTYIGGGGTEVAEVVRGGDGRVFVVGPGSRDMKLAAGTHQASHDDAPESDDSSSEEEDEEEDVFTLAMDNFCQAFSYARNVFDAVNWFRDQQ